MTKHCLQCNQIVTIDTAHYGQHLICFERVFKVKGRDVFQSLAPQSSASDPTETPFQNDPHLTSYFSGHYRKYEGTLSGTSYILKMSKGDYPELAPVEYVCNRIADACGLNIPRPYALIEIAEGEMSFVSRNFMEKFSTHATLHHLYHSLDPGPEHYNVEEISRAIYRETRSVEDVEMFFRMLLFDALIGNHDRHGRNLAFVQTSRSKRLAPIYDNPSCLGLESGPLLKASFAPKGKIWTMASREPEMREYLEEIDRLGVSQVFRDLHASIDPSVLQGFIRDACFLSDDMRDAMERLVQVRYEALDDYVRHQ